MADFIKEWTLLMESGTGERGIFNRACPVPARRDNRYEFGVNPCGEITLRPYQFCNLSIVVARPDDTLETLSKKIRLATQFGIIQSLLTNFRYIRPEWKENCEDERLLGVDITGQMDCALLSGPSRFDVYTHLRGVAQREATQLSAVLGINMPASITCVKPSGNSSQLLNVSSGIHPRFAQFYIRRLRMGASSPVTQLLIEKGVPHFPEVGQPPTNPTIWVFEFPVAAPQGAKLRQDMDAMQQLEQWLDCKLGYTEHNPSCTIYVKEHEWLKVGAWVYDNWGQIGGLSFLPYDGGIYDLAPYEQIEQSEYEKRLREWPLIDFADVAKFEHGDNTELNREFACTGDKGCEL
jgi:ribonucleoside-diphosphate reductase alpha chain